MAGGEELQKPLGQLARRRCRSARAQRALLPSAVASATSAMSATLLSLMTALAAALVRCVSAGMSLAAALGMMASAAPVPPLAASRVLAPALAPTLASPLTAGGSALAATGALGVSPALATIVGMTASPVGTPGSVSHRIVTRACS